MPTMIHTFFYNRNEFQVFTNCFYPLILRRTFWLFKGTTNVSKSRFYVFLNCIISPPHSDMPCWCHVLMNDFWRHTVACHYGIKYWLWI